MEKPKKPLNEAQRLAALESYQILNTDTEQDYDNLTKLASDLCGTPISLISLIDSDRQWFKSHFGLSAQETPREIAFCAHAIHQTTPFIVEDSRTDQRFHDNPLVTGAPHVIFYAGIPLIDKEGFALGTLCVIDSQPKKLTETQIEGLDTIGKQVISNLILRRELNQKRNEARRIESLFAQVPGMVYQFQAFSDGSSCFPFASQAINEIYEVSPEAVKKDASVVFSRIYKEDSERFTQSISMSAKDLSDWRLDYRVSLPTKGLRWLRGFAHPEKLADQSTIWHGIIADVTSQKDVESIVELQRLQIANSAKFASLGEMASGVAHEINNPLAIIIGKISILERAVDKPTLDLPKIKEELVKTSQSALRISKIVKILKALTQDAEHEPLITSKLNQVLEDTLELCYARFKNHGIELRTKLEDDFSISCKPTQISQVLMNLLNNAFDAAQGQDNKWVSLEVEKVGTNIHITVTDSGKGISQEVAKKIMQPFFTTKEVGKGTGLGLTISKRMILEHKGDLTYDSTCPNTKFIVSLPLK